MVNHFFFFVFAVIQWFLTCVRLPEYRPMNFAKLKSSNGNCTQNLPVYRWYTLHRSSSLHGNRPNWLSSQHHVFARAELSSINNWIGHGTDGCLRQTVFGWRTWSFKRRCTPPRNRQVRTRIIFAHRTKY